MSRAIPVPARGKVAASGPQLGLAAPEAQQDARDQEDGREREPDRNGGGVAYPVSIHHEGDRLRADDRGNRRQQRLPVALRRDHRGRRKDDHREGRGGGGHARVDGLERRRKRGADQPDARQDLRAPCEGDRRRQRRDGAGERESERVGHEVIARRCRRKRCVGPGRARSHGGESGEELAVAGADDDPRAENECRGDRPEEDALGGPDPPAVRGEHEQQADTQRRHGSADDREAARAEELPALDELARGGAGRARCLPGRQLDGRMDRPLHLGLNAGRSRWRGDGLASPLHRRRKRLGRLGTRERSDLAELVAERIDPTLDRVEAPRKPVARCVVLAHAPSSSGSRVMLRVKRGRPPGGSG